MAILAVNILSRNPMLCNVMFGREKEKKRNWGPWVRGYYCIVM